jgi:lactate dehydrogenase-like 2-hydroxyacid dehydrogenase
MAATPKVFATHEAPAAAMEILERRCEVSIHRGESPIRPEQLAVICREQGIEGLLLIGARVTAQVVNEAIRLRAISSASVGYDHIDVAACTARGIPVMTARGTLEETTADLAFALLLAVARRVVEGDRYVREGRWKQWEWELLWGADVHGKTLGAVGFGKIGQAMARRAAGFSMKVLYHARNRVDEALERELNVSFASLETLLRESDFVTLNVPLTSETQHLIQSRELSWMRTSAFLINTARGRIVDEEALVEALQAGRLAGAGLDVFEHEPKIHPALLAMPNVVLLPHVGSGTTETRVRTAKLAAENLVAALNGRRASNVVNPEVLG